MSTFKSGIETYFFKKYLIFSAHSSKHALFSQGVVCLLSWCDVCLRVCVCITVDCRFACIQVLCCATQMGKCVWQMQLLLLLLLFHVSVLTSGPSVVLARLICRWRIDRAIAPRLACRNHSTTSYLPPAMATQSLLDWLLSLTVRLSQPAMTHHVLYLWLTTFFAAYDYVLHRLLWLTTFFVYD